MVSHETKSSATGSGIFSVKKQFQIFRQNQLEKPETEILEYIPEYNHGRKWKDIPIWWSKDEDLRVIILSI